eukprot:jgi/Botrbrau1/3175/Bobra.37_2s0005.1
MGTATLWASNPKVAVVILALCIGRTIADSQTSIEAANPICPININATAPVCGTSTDFITVQDNGDGTCTGAIFVTGLPNSAVNCRSLVFPTICGSYLGSLNIVLTRQKPNLPYITPQISRWLSQMGLDLINVLGGTLTVSVDNTPYPVPGPQSPFFLQILSQVGSLVIQECQNCGLDPNTPPSGTARTLSALPGLGSLKRFSGTANSLIVRATRFQDFFQTFGSLVCSPTFVQIEKNRVLTSFNGLKITADTPGPFFNAPQNAVVGTSSGVAALRSLAGCPSGTTSPLTSQFYLETTTCVLRTWNQLCTLANRNTCQRSPPSPPPRPPPPSPRPPPPRPPPPRPPPPPTVSCITPTTFVGACGKVGETINVRDNGDGTCSASRFTSTGGSVIPCNTPVFPGVNCSSYQGALILLFVNKAGANYKPPTMQIFLTQMGLGNITLLGGPLTVYVDYVLGAIPGTINPYFLPNLREANGVVVKECLNCFENSDNTPPGIARALVSLPGLAQLYRIAPPTNPLLGAALIVANTAFTDFSTFVGLKCSPTFVLVRNNAGLTSLQGLQNIGAAARPGPPYAISGSPLLTANASTQLTRLAGCPAPSPSSPPDYRHPDANPELHPCDVEPVLQTREYRRVPKPGFPPSATSSAAISPAPSPAISTAPSTAISPTPSPAISPAPFPATAAASISTSSPVRLPFDSFLNDVMRLLSPNHLHLQPAPPPPADCSISIPANTPICGSGDILLIIDKGDGSQQVVSSLGYNGPCTTNLYPGPCGSFAGSLNLTVANAGLGTYIPPQFAQCLTTLGLAGINYVTKLGVVVNNGLNAPVPAGFYDFGLSTVRVVDTLYVAEDRGFRHVPGRKRPSEYRHCARRQHHWRELNIEAAPDNGPSMVMTRNPLTTGPPLAPLATLALCTNDGSILSTPLYISVSNCANPITTYTQLCRALRPVPICPLT